MLVPNNLSRRKRRDAYLEMDKAKKELEVLLVNFAEAVEPDAQLLFAQMISTNVYYKKYKSKVVDTYLDWFILEIKTENPDGFTIFCTEHSKLAFYDRLRIHPQLHKLLKV